MAAALNWRDHVLERDVRLDAAGLFLMIGADPSTTWLHEAGVELDAMTRLGGRSVINGTPGSGPVHRWAVIPFPPIVLGEGLFPVPAGFRDNRRDVGTSRADSAVTLARVIEPG